MTHAPHAHGKRKPAKSGPELLIAAAVIGAVLLLVGFGIYWSGRAAPDVDAAGFPGEIIATEKPVRAVHDMGLPSTIPFLPAGGPQPNVEAPETFYDFGKIGAKDVVTRTFLVRNTGDAPLTISKAYTTCGCTTADISATVIPPGEAATVKLVFDAGFHDAAGQTVRRGVILENNDPDQPQAEMWVQAEVGSK